MDNLLKLRRAKEDQAIISLEVQRVLQWLDVEIHAYNYGQEWNCPWIIVRLQHLERMVSGFCRELRKLSLDVSEDTKHRFLVLQQTLTGYLTHLWNPVEVPNAVSVNDSCRVDLSMMILMKNH